jgi:hypothetical protein
MKTRPAKTLKSIAGLIQHHESQLAALRTVMSSLQSRPRCIYEIHIQAQGPKQRPIMVSGGDLLALCHMARRFDLAYNNRHSASFELFVRCGELRVAMDPGDAMGELLGRNEGFTFSLDKRISTFPAPVIFRVGQEMPSAHYATVPTPEPTSVPSAF